MERIQSLEILQRAPHSVVGCGHTDDTRLQLDTECLSLFDFQVSAELDSTANRDNADPNSDKNCPDKIQSIFTWLHDTFSRSPSALDFVVFKKGGSIRVVEWDRDDVLVFVSSAVQFSVFPHLKRLAQTGIFLTTVAIFLVERYKLLSPGLNNAIIASISQIAHQLVSISNVTLFQSNASFKPPTAAIKINVTWFLSLVLSA